MDDHWALLKNVIRWVKCDAWQNPSEADLPISHADNCTLAMTLCNGLAGADGAPSELPTVPGRFARAASLEANTMLAPLNLPVDLHT